MEFLYAISSAIIVSFISILVLLIFSFNKLFEKPVTLILVGLATGAMFGDVFIHLLPEIAESTGFGIVESMGILLGLILFFVVEKFLHWRHCHDNDCNDHSKQIHPIATINIVGDSLHNFIDGLLIGGSFLVDPVLGLGTTIAIVLHEIPQEIGDFGVLVHSGLSKRKAFLFNFFTALIAILGVIVSFLIGTTEVVTNSILLPITAGGFIYIAGSDLIPELKHHISFKNSIFQFLAILTGLFFMYLLTYIE